MKLKSWNVKLCESYMSEWKQIKDTMHVIEVDERSTRYWWFGWMNLRANWCSKTKFLIKSYRYQYLLVSLIICLAIFGTNDTNRKFFPFVDLFGHILCGMRVCNRCSEDLGSEIYLLSSFFILIFKITVGFTQNVTDSLKRHVVARPLLIAIYRVANFLINTS